MLNCFISVMPDVETVEHDSSTIAADPELMVTLSTVRVIRSISAVIASRGLMNLYVLSWELKVRTEDWMSAAIPLSVFEAAS